MEPHSESHNKIEWNRARFDNYENEFLDKYCNIASEPDPNDKYQTVTKYNHQVALQMIYFGRKLSRYSS